MAATTVKLDETLVAKLGGSGAVEERIKALLDAEKISAELKGSIDSLVTQGKDLPVKLGAIDDRLKALEARPTTATVTDAQMAEITAKAEEQAKVAAAKEVSSAIAKVGVQSVPAGGNAQPGTPGEPKAPRWDAGKEELQAFWNANSTVRDEFPDFESWAAYHRADGSNRLRIFQKTGEFQKQEGRN